MLKKLNSLIRFIRKEYHINQKNSFSLSQGKKISYRDSFGAHREPSSGSDLDLVMSRDFDCIPLDWFLVVNKLSSPSPVTSRGQVHSLTIVLDENRYCDSK